MGDGDEMKVVKAELEFCQSKLEEDGARADALIEFTKSKQDPFSDGFTGENPWVSSKGGGGGGCAIL